MTPWLALVAVAVVLSSGCGAKTGLGTAQGTAGGQGAPPPSSSTRGAGSIRPVACERTDDWTPRRRLVEDFADPSAIGLYVATSRDGQTFGAPRVLAKTQATVVSLTEGELHPELDAVFDGASTVVVYDDARGQRSQIFLRQLDGTGVQRFEPVQVSYAEAVSPSCCARATGPRATTDGDGHVTVYWAEAASVAKEDEQTVVKAARFTCATHG